MISQLIVRLNSTWLALALSAVVAAILVESLILLSEPPGLGVTMSSLGGDVQRLTYVVPASPAWDAGLRPGDIVRPLAPPLSSSIWRQFEVIEGTLTGQIVSIERPWPTGNDAPLFVLGLEFLVAGLTIFLRATDRPAASRFLVFAWLCSITFIISQITATGHTWVIYTEWIADKTAVAAFALFFLTTPVRRWRFLQRLITWSLPPLLILFTYTILVDPGLYDGVKQVGFAYIIIGIAAGVAALVRPFLDRSSHVHREYWPVLVFSVAAFSVFPIASLVPYLFLGRYLLKPEWAVLAWGMLPIGFVWAMLRYRLMGTTLGSGAILRIVFDAVSDPIFVVMRDGRLIEASRAGLALLGINQINQARRKFSEMIGGLETPGAEDEPTNTFLTERVLSGAVVSDERMRLRVDGDATRNMSIAGTPILDAGGQVDLAVMIYRDITVHIQAQDELATRVAAAELSKANEKLHRILGGVIHSMGVMVELNDPYTAGHQQRVAMLSEAIAREMGLPAERIAGIAIAANVHDIGKISVPVELLNKPSALTDGEFNTIRRHSQVGHDILKSIEFPWPVALTVLQHHERMDGSGYPLGLKDQEIIVEAQIVAVADVVEAMAFARPYRAALGLEAAEAEIIRHQGVLFDREVVSACSKIIAKKDFDWAQS